MSPTHANLAYQLNEKPKIISYKHLAESDIAVPRVHLANSMSTSPSKDKLLVSDVIESDSEEDLQLLNPLILNLLGSEVLHDYLEEQDPINVDRASTRQSLSSKFVLNLASPVIKSSTVNNKSIVWPNIDESNESTQITNRFISVPSHIRARSVSSPDIAENKSSVDPTPSSGPFLLHEHNNNSSTRAIAPLSREFSVDLFLGSITDAFNPSPYSEDQQLMHSRKSPVHHQKASLQNYDSNDGLLSDVNSSLNSMSIYPSAKSSVHSMTSSNRQSKTHDGYLYTTNPFAAKGRNSSTMAIAPSYSSLNPSVSELVHSSEDSFQLLAKKKQETASKQDECRKQLHTLGVQLGSPIERVIAQSPSNLAQLKEMAKSCTERLLLFDSSQKEFKETIEILQEVQDIISPHVLTIDSPWVKQLLVDYSDILVDLVREKLKK